MKNFASIIDFDAHLLEFIILNPPPSFVSKTLLPYCIIAWLLGILNVAGSIMKFCSLVGAHSHFRHDSHGNME